MSDSKDAKKVTGGRNKRKRDKNGCFRGLLDEEQPAAKERKIDDSQEASDTQPLPLVSDAKLAISKIGFDGAQAAAELLASPV